MCSALVGQAFLWWRRALLLAATTSTFLLFLLTSQTARADGSGQFWADMSFSVYRGKATAVLEAPQETALRSYDKLRVGEVPIPSTLSGNAGLDLVFDDRYILPLFGIGAGAPIGMHSPIRTSVDGSMVELRPWEGFLLQFHLPGFGVRLKERRWLFEATFRTAAVIRTMNARISTGRDIETAALLVATFSMRTDLQICRRLDPDNRFCFVAAPRIFEHNWFSGISFGLRWEYGP